MIGINCAIIAMDLLLLSLEYADFYAVQITLKGFVFPISWYMMLRASGREETSAPRRSSLTVSITYNVDSLEYADFYAVQITLKGFVYSLKLKLEFAVLGRLAQFIPISWYMMLRASGREETSAPRRSSLTVSITYSRICRLLRRANHSEGICLLAQTQA
jgi:hypothetical protein